MKPFIKSAAFAIIGVLFGVCCFAQSIKGTVKDSTGKAVPFATVNLKNNATNAIMAYAITDEKGVYTLQVPANTAASNLAVEVRSLGFRTQGKNIVGFGAPVDFMLSTTANLLQGVLINSSRPVLHTNGDTLSYKVSQFSSAEDRVIGDVIKKLPGITVAADGTISYNNKPVSGVYIGGDNLLDGRYNIATGSIPHGDVDQVQVIQNDQPIKLLQNKVVSDDVALNLTIKKAAKLHMVGQESMGAGLPGNYDVNLDALMFKDKYKAINYLKGNNTGYDVQRDLVQHNHDDYIQRIENDVPATVLSLGAVNTPALQQDRYLFNQSGIINLNNLVNLKKSVQLKVNASYLHDTQRQDYTQQTIVFLPGDTVKYKETQHNRLRPDMLHTQFTLKINRSAYYLNDVLLMDYDHQTNYSGLNTDSNIVNQVFKDNAVNFSNELNLMKITASNKIIQGYSYVSHSTEPENRMITPGYNAGIFNANTPYAQLVQNVNIPSWYTNNYVSLKIPGDLGTESFRTGFSVQSQMLTSNLNVVQNNHSVTLEQDSALNHVNWAKKKVYSEAAYDLPGKTLKLNITLPVTLQQINYSDSLYGLYNNLARVYFNPQLLLKYQVGNENYFNLQYNYRNQTGSIQDIYRGYILKDYRTLYANNADLTERQNQLANIGFNYRKTLTLFFWSVNAQYNHIQANNIASSIITNNIQQGYVLPYANSNDAWAVNGYISKYSFPLHTTYSASVQWQSARQVQIQNNALLPFNTTSKRFNLGTETKVSKWVNFSYSATFIETASHSAVEASAYHIIQLQQEASVHYNPVAALQFKLSGDHYFTRQHSNPDLAYFFADASAKLKIDKWKTDLELSTVNLLNIKTYNALYLQANTLTASSYTLPGRIVMLKVWFNL